MAKFFIFNRGCHEKDLIPKASPTNFQSHKKATEQTVAEGHAVRALYMFCAIADLALETEDEALRQQVKTVFDDIVANKMFITGGVGSLSNGEAFGPEYYLPNLNAYAETCAGIAFAFFAHRLSELFTNSVYADVIERLLYNGILSGVDLNGDHFFYENPLELRPKLQNLKLGSTVQLTLGQLTTNAQLAIAAAGAFTKESANAKAYLDAGYFTCATAGKSIREENGVLIID
jgi:DUF1680 family protein